MDSITYQGVFNEHTFSTGGPECEQVLVVQAHAAFLPRSRDATFPGEHLWIGCFLKSCRDGQPRDGVPIDLVVVLDISGSMGGTIGGGCGDSRLTLAKQALNHLLPKLGSDDRLGLATFNGSGHLVKPLTPAPRLIPEGLPEQINGLSASGGTTLAAGMDAAIAIYKDAPEVLGVRHRRLLFLTDMGDMSPDKLDWMVAEQAKQGLFVSFVGIGMEFNAGLAEVLSKHQGANYFCITRPEEMQKVVVKDFDFNFFPVAFDVEVAEQSDSFELDCVYGTQFDTREEPLQADWLPSTHRFFPADIKAQAKTLLLCARRCSKAQLPMPALQKIMGFLATGVSTIIRVDTVFPSCVESNGSVEGGLVLLKMKPKAGAVIRSGIVRLTVRYKVDGEEHARCEDLQVPSHPGPMDAELRKGIMLQRYVAVCRTYLSIAHGSPTTEELQKPLDALKSLQKEYQSDAEQTEALCPGVLHHLTAFMDSVSKDHELRQGSAQAEKAPQTLIEPPSWIA